MRARAVELAGYATAADAPARLPEWTLGAVVFAAAVGLFVGGWLYSRRPSVPGSRGERFPVGRYGSARKYPHV